MGLRNKNIGQDLSTAWGTHTSVSASDTIDTGLRQVDTVVATLQDDPVIGADRVTAVPAGGGKITIKTFKPTAAGDSTPVAASTFGRKINWVAEGV